MVSTAVSVASFSVVLAEAFSAVGLSTLVPNTFIAAVRAAKATLDDPNATAAKKDEARADLRAAAGTNDRLAEVLLAAVDTDALDVLLPNSAKIHAEFEFQGSEKYEYGAEMGAMVEVVTIRAGYNALYETSSKNKITLDVSFAPVNVKI